MIRRQRKRIFIPLIILLSFSTAYGAKEIPYTQDDRDRLIRVETKVEEGLKAINQKIDTLEKKIDQRIDSLDKRIDGLERSLRGEIQALRELVYVVIAGIFILIGFVIWDRRTALAPAIRKGRELEEREELLEKALKEYAKVEPRLADILKSLRLM